MAKPKHAVTEFSLDVLRHKANASKDQQKRSVVNIMSGHHKADPAVAFGSGTDVGRMRDHNEDSLFVAPPLFVVADGMGGAAAGEVASELAVQTISDLAPNYPNAQMLRKAVQAANEAVYNAATRNTARKGMGTTVTAALLKGTRLVIAQVGDSRAYLLHQGTLQQLTRDHSVVAGKVERGEITPEEARRDPERNVITRALGTTPTVDCDIYELNVSPGDRLLLCSDGLNSMLEDSVIQNALLRFRDPQNCVNNLIYSANEAGGADNVTVIVVDVNGTDTRARAHQQRQSILTIVLIVLVAAALILGAIALIKALIGG